MPYTRKEPCKTKCKNCLRFVCDPKAKTVFGRGCVEWAQLCIYYIGFVLILAFMFIVLGALTLLTITRYSAPWREKDRSALGATPGLSFQPRLEMDTPNIWYKWNGEDEKYSDYVEALDEFFNDYKKQTPNSHRNCSESYSGEKPCYFDLKSLGPCAESPYGYKDMKPCIILKLNKVFSWQPSGYRSTDQLPKDMPNSLKNKIKRFPGMGVGVWVACQGRHAADEKRIGPLAYYPDQAFPAAFYPFSGQPGYMSPLIAVKFNGLTLDTVVNVKCRAWAKNIGPRKPAVAYLQLLVGNR